MTVIEQTNNLKGKYCVITGANRGIGLAITLAFLSQGAHVIACVRDTRSLNHIDNPNLNCVELDLAEDENIQHTIKAIRTLTKKIDVLVNCAGIASGGVFQMVPMGTIKRDFQINVFGPIALSQGISRLMARNKSGVIINISSSTAQHIDSGTLSYGASKAALERASLSMATELGQLGIRVNVVAPGVTSTDMANQMDSDAREQLIQKSALNKAALPEEIASVVVFLASDQAKHITGQIIGVDGGII